MNKFQNKYRIKSHRMPGWDYSGNGYYFITLVTQNRECNLGEIAVSADLGNSFGLCNSNDSNHANYSHDSYGSHVEKQGRASLQSNHQFPHQSNHQTAYIQLSDFGKIVNDEWLKSFEIRDELLLDTYIIMPNHLHAIVVLEQNQTKINDMDCSHGSHDSHGSHGSHGSHVETHGRASLQSSQPSSNQSPEQTQKQPFVRKPKSISSFIGGFKSSVNSKIDDYIDVYHLDIPKYNRNNHFFQSNYHDHIIRNESEYQRILEYIINNPLKWNDDKFNPDNKEQLI